MRQLRRAFNGGYRLTKIEATVMVALNDRELPYLVHKPIDDYVADILIPTLRLVIECDGAYHHNHRPDSDQARDAAMNQLGYHVLRLTEDEITNKVWDRLDDAIHRLSIQGGSIPEYRTPPGCTGLQMQDGTRYDAGRDGRITVDRPDHARHIERVGRNGGGHVHKVMVGAPVGVPSKQCSPCRFTAYSWQSRCPKCGGDLILKGDADALRPL